MLIVFSGLPGTGKTTIAKGLALKTGAVYLRIDTIEQAIRNAGVRAQDVGKSGYAVANELAFSNLDLGSTVIADCVNPVGESREAWDETARRAGATLLNVRVFCSDPVEHQRRVEQRQSDIAGLAAPTWQSVLEHDYEEWTAAPFSIDTARISAEQAVALIAQRLLNNAFDTDAR